MENKNHAQLQRDKFIKKLVSNSKAILSNQVGLPLGMLKMGKLIYWISLIEPVLNVDFQIVKDYNTLTQKFAVGTERLAFNKEFLKTQDKELDKISASFKGKIIDKCFEIIEVFKA